MAAPTGPMLVVLSLLLCWTVSSNRVKTYLNKSDDAGTSSKSSLMCCCDSEIPPTKTQPMRCRYVTPDGKMRRLVTAWNPLTEGCPIQDLGRGKALLHSPRNPEKCLLTGAEEIEPEKTSKERDMCKVRESLDNRFFPPEMVAVPAVPASGAVPPSRDFAIRVAVPPVPGLGRIFVGIKDIEVVQLDMGIVMVRKSDDIFSFKVTGEHGKGQAKVQAYIHGLDYQLPDSTSSSLIGLVQNLEHYTAKLLTLGIAKNYGTLDNSPLSADFNLAGDFQLDDEGEISTWTVTNREGDAKVSVGSGGIVNTLLNVIIQAFGGMEKIIFEQVWPLVQQLISVKVGQALKTVPKASGDIDIKVNVKGRCIERDNDKRCPSQKLKLELDFSSEMHYEPHLFISSLIGSDFFAANEFAQDLASKSIKQFEKGEGVFKGTYVSAEVGVSASTELLGLNVFASPNVVVPFGLISSMFPVGNFVDESQPLFLNSGAVGVANGVATLYDVELAGVRLPADAEGGVMEFGAELEFFTVELDECEGDKGIFAADSGIAVNSPGIMTQISKEMGFSLRADMLRSAEEHVQIGFNVDAMAAPAQHSMQPLKEQQQAMVKQQQQQQLTRRLKESEGEDAFVVHLGEEYIKSIFKNVSEGMLKPRNVRNTSESTADGIVPTKFARPYARFKAPLPLMEMISELETNLLVEMGASEKAKMGGPDLFKTDLHLRTEGTLTLSRQVYSFFANGHDSPDYGYLHFTLPGFVGSHEDFEKNEKQSMKPVLAYLTCGNLELWDLNKDEKPFHGAPHLQLDLAEEPSKMAGWFGEEHEPLTYKSENCILISEEKGFFKGYTRKFFCSGNKEGLADLRKGLLLQIQRLQDSSSQWPKACAPGPNGAEPICMGNPDGTWFRQFSPFDIGTFFPQTNIPTSKSDVSSPLDQWKHALAAFD